MICRQSVSQKPDIIILMMESLSNYQSRLFSGINNWMPVLDSIAEKNMYFTHFVANGFTTEDGEISLLKGQVPITPPNTFTTGGGTAFAGFYGEDNSLPLYLSQNGYSTSFLTSSDLKFSNTGNWAKSLGFEYVEGSKHPYYDQWPRYQFNAAPDDALYQRIIQHLDEKTSKAKRFIFVKTVSTHHPYLDPVSGSHSEEKTFRYADQALGRLYAALEKRDFFRNGLLVIVGDHHSMVPLRSSEIQKFGMLDAQSKIPLIIVGKDKAKPVSERYQQIDIHNSLKSLVLGQSCTSQWIGDVLAKIPPKYIIHRRGDNRAAVNVYSDRLGATEIFLDGDTTYAVGDAPEQQAFVAKINQLRIQ
jgi:phosphoglycerol transferase MdoB-like AlkP superfamily enzyme